MKEGFFPNAGNAFRNGDACQTGAEFEGVISDAGDRIASNGVRKDKLTGGGVIAIGNDDFAVGGGVS